MQLTTERLLLRKPTPADADMRRHLDQWERNGIGKLVVTRLADGAEGQPELGWTLRPEHRGRGYATEAARAVRDWYEGPPLVSLIQPANERSQAVARRLGARPERTIELPDGPHVIWVHPSAKIRTR